MLKSLEISGFKSFAKKTELHFKSQITAIVGPNGSGKSNVAEAFRFALGEQSIKSMRGKKGEDLIWNGSNEAPKSNRASVKITLDNPQHHDLSKEKDKFFGEKYPFEEIIIERVVNRDGSNEYLLNGSQVRLKDIFELLAEAHIGSSGHHIISQGEADRILSANSKEKKEIIEDALGLKIYQYKRTESEKKLEKTEENIKKVESLRREIAPHLRFLKKQVEKIEKAEEMREKLTKFYRQYLKIEKIYLETENQKIKSEREPLEEELSHLEKEIEEAKIILENSNKKDNKSDELIAVENKIKKEREKKDFYFREIGKIEGEINATQRQILITKSNAQSEEKKTVPLSEIEELEKEISTFSEISKIFQRIREFIGKYKISAYSNQTTNLEKLENLVSNLEKEKEKIEQKIKEIDKNLLEFDLEYKGIKDSIEKEKNTERDAEKNIFKISSKIDHTRNKLDLINEKGRRLEIEQADWKREIQEAGVLIGTAVVGFENDVLEEGTPFDKASREESHKELERMKIRLEELGGTGSFEVAKEYKEVSERDEYLQKELDDLKKSAESLQQLIKELAEKINVEFKQGIEKINIKFQEFFEIMFGGGEAKLQVIKIKKTEVRKLEDLVELEENVDKAAFGKPDASILEEGIEIEVSLPRKKIKGLDMLSGGERALTSIALLFAISQVNPPPFIILDETDAALDEANSKKYGDMIEELSKVSQLILITHNRETMSRAGVIYGVTMGRDSVSRLLSIAFDEAVAVAK